MPWMRVELDDWRIVRERLAERGVPWLDEEIAIDLRWLEARVQARASTVLPYDQVLPALPSDRALGKTWGVSRRRARWWLDHPDAWRDPHLIRTRTIAGPHANGGSG